MRNNSSVTNFSYQIPVQIYFGRGYFQRLAEWVRGRRVLIITSAGFVERGLVDKLNAAAIWPVAVVSDISPNPTLSQMAAIYTRLDRSQFDVILAIGGGSVMDSAKVFSVDAPHFSLISQYILGEISHLHYTTTPLICVPTTAGTSSELTPWATIWDMDLKQKFSLHLPDLWPEACIYDPELTHSLPRQLTLQTGLDALSHCLESIWNIQANPISTAFAIQGAKLILATLPDLLSDLDNQQCRDQMMLATVYAGLAFSNTQTAVAHAISYYLTAKYGVAHGIACSFSLPHIAYVAQGISEPVDAALNEIFGQNPSEKIKAFFDTIGVSHLLWTYLPQDDFPELCRSVFQNNRIKNGIVPMDTLFEVLRTAC